MYLTADKKNYLHYEILKNVVPTTTLFIHGNLASNRWWGPLIRSSQLRPGPENKGDIIFAEIRGCGQSSDVDQAEHVSIASLSQDFLKLVRILELKDFNIVGHSTGGDIALLMMSEVSDLVKKAVLVNTVGVHGRKLTAESLKTFQRMKTDKKLVAEVMRPTISAPDIEPKFFQDVIVQDAFRATQVVGLKIALSFEEFEITELVKKITNSVLVLHSDRDQILPLSDAQELADLLPNAELEIMPNIGHCPNLQDPYGLWLRLSQFLSF